MQWLMASYAQKVTDARGLGLRMLAVLPLQLLEGTTIGMRAATTYGALSGTTAEAFMQRYDAPLDAEKVAAEIVRTLGDDVPSGMSAIAIKGTGVEYLP
jgi:3-oxoacyl-[acyl-carrier protein] reductase